MYAKDVLAYTCGDGGVILSKVLTAAMLEVYYIAAL